MSSKKERRGTEQMSRYSVARERSVVGEVRVGMGPPVRMWVRERGESAMLDQWRMSRNASTSSDGFRG